MEDRLRDYRHRRDAARTPEPMPRPDPQLNRRRSRRTDSRARFVVQQHHARRLHWDLRLERDGVLVSWAVPRGLPREPGRNHLAVHTEDHPLDYLDFHGEIPAGEYGGGRMTIHDRGTYRCEKWQADEVAVVLAGERIHGRYVLFATAGRDWMVRRTDPAPPGWTSMPELVRPMHPTPAPGLPRDGAAWGYEMRWDGVRAVAHLSGGRLTLRSEAGADITGAYPWLRGLGEALAPAEAVFDGVLVDIDPEGRVRPPVGERRRRSDRLGQYLVFDLLWFDGVSSLELPYAQRRELLDGLGVSGPHWQTTPWFPGAGAETLAAARDQGFPGVVAKRLDAAYEPGLRSRHWRSIGVR